jgi:CheY-like chemotaxis protein
MSAIRPLRIFLVENHIDTLKWLTLYLQQMVHTVVSARTMEGALTALPEANCEVLISDIGLPDGDGWQLLQRLRDVTMTLPRYAIAMSGYGMNADRFKSKAAGYSQHILNPSKRRNSRPSSARRFTRWMNSAAYATRIRAKVAIAPPPLRSGIMWSSSTRTFVSETEKVSNSRPAPFGLKWNC